MKKIKYYVPVYGTNLRVDKFPEVEQLIPEADIIAEHLLAQRKLMDEGDKYQALQYFITEERYKSIVKGIKRKTGKEYIDGYINVVYDNQTNPLLQIAIKAEVESKEE